MTPIAPRHQTILYKAATCSSTIIEKATARRNGDQLGDTPWERRCLACSNVAPITNSQRLPVPMPAGSTATPDASFCPSGCYVRRGAAFLTVVRHHLAHWDALLQRPSATDMGGTGGTGSGHLRSERGILCGVSGRFPIKWHCFWQPATCPLRGESSGRTFYFGWHLSSCRSSSR